jgi:hypothetical protein
LVLLDLRLLCCVCAGVEAFEVLFCARQEALSFALVSRSETCSRDLGDLAVLGAQRAWVFVKNGGGRSVGLRRLWFEQCFCAECDTDKTRWVPAGL